jgi:hypothetical protein
VFLCIRLRSARSACFEGGDGLLQFKFERVFCEGLIRDVAIFYSGREPRGEPGGDSEWDARGCDRGSGVC